MKLVAAALLVMGMLCNSALAMADGPVPFRTLMQSAGAQPTVPQATDGKDKSTNPTQPARPSHMTRGGKIMTGVGVVMVASGGLVIAGTAALHDFASTTRKAALYGGGGACATGGAVLIVLGIHRRSTQ
jgi:hypothetical protein